jgi:hypothetical protein
MPTTTRKPRLTWEERHASLQHEFPLIDWDEAARVDPHVFSDLMEDVLRAEGKRSMPGKRPALSRQVAESEYARLTQQDYSEIDFTSSFRALVAGQSVKSTRGLAHKTGISKDRICELLNGRPPTMEQMEKIAAGFRKNPEYFMEYRANRVVERVWRYLMASPEVSATWYRRLTKEGIRIR